MLGCYWDTPSELPHMGTEPIYSLTLDTKHTNHYAMATAAPTLEN